jgi:predicted nucleic acid-binding protein
VASAEDTYADPSALAKLYLHEPESRTVTAWRAKLGGSLAVTLFGRLELANAIGLAAYRGFVTKAVRKSALGALDDDFAQGRCVVVDLVWREALRRAEEISREETAVLGCRSLDILHVASALTLKRRRFLTFDLRQQKLARALGLKLVVL